MHKTKKMYIINKSEDFVTFLLKVNPYGNKIRLMQCYDFSKLYKVFDRC